MNLPVLARILVSVVAAGLLTSCNLVANQPTASLLATASPLASASPIPTVPTSNAPTTPTSTPTLRPPPVTDSPPPVTDAPPPRGVLTEDGTAVEGWLGSYCWHSLCADVPGTPPKDQLPHAWSEYREIEFSLTDGATFHTWRATYAIEADASQSTLGEGGEGFDPDATASAEPELFSSVTFDPPPGGDWVVFVQVFFDGGDLSYAWNVRVPLTPPSAELKGGGNPATEGSLGSWCYDVGCADKPGPSKESLPALDIRRGAALRFAFEDGDEFRYAHATYALEGDSEETHELSTIGEYGDPDPAISPSPTFHSFEFEAPGRGDWVVNVYVLFPGVAGGDATYSWRVIVQ
jgi:hypothetical protein